MSHTPSIRKRPPRPLLPPHWWRWPLRVLVALALLAGALAVGAWGVLKYEQRQGNKSLAAAVRATDQRERRWLWAEMQEDFDPIPEERNSTPVILKVADASRRMDVNGTFGLHQSIHSLSEPPNRRLSERRLGQLCETLARDEACVALAASLSDFPRGRQPMPLTPGLPRTDLAFTDNCRSAVGVLVLDGERSLHAGRVPDAVARVRAIVNVGEALRDEPFSYSQSTRLFLRRRAIELTQRLLASGEIADADCRRLGELFAARLNDNLLLAVARGERAAYHEWMTDLEAGRSPLDKGLEELNRDMFKLSVWEPAYRYRVPEDHAFLLRRYSDLVEAARLPVETRWSQWQRIGAKTEAEFVAAQGRHRLVLSLLLLMRSDGPWQKGGQIMRDQAETCCVVVALAAERFRMKHKRWPKTPDELVPAYLPAPVVDPFDGGGLHFKAFADGILVEARGGGSVNVVRVRLYDPDKRGLPALPEDQHKDSLGGQAASRKFSRLARPCL